ncbi:MAG: hypothetical protein GEU94_05895 [Micromonosporaceae bacterium]|nr:hypothetical protein [Micromonosporaceae bacterium]
MPASHTTSGWRGRWLPIVFWAGVGLAPLAAILLLVSQGGGPLRVAAVLAIMSVVLVGLSTTLRDDVDTVRAEFEETVYDETDAIREDVREDLVAAARKIHGVLQAEIEALAGQVEELRSQLPDRRAAAPKAVGAAGATSVADGRGHVAGGSRGANGAAMSNGPARRGAAAGFGHASARAAAPASPRDNRRNDLHERVVEPARVTADVGGRHDEGVGQWRHNPAPSRPALEAPRRWDPLSDDLGDQPAGRHGHDRLDERTAAWRTSPASGRGGHRRAADPDDDYDEPTLSPTRDSGRRGGDPWADLRGQTQPAEVRFGARAYEGDVGHSDTRNGGGQLADVRELRPDTHLRPRAEADPLAPGWNGASERSPSSRAAASRRW